MTRRALVVALLALAGPLLAQEAQRADAPVLELRWREDVLRIQLEVTINGRPPEERWQAFLARLLKDFDGNRNGTLSQAELALVPILPGQQDVSWPFAQVDRDGNGQVTLDEMQRHAAQHDCGPLVVFAEDPSGEDERLGQVLRNALDQNNDGRLQRNELERAPLALRSLDLDDNEIWDRQELLKFAWFPEFASARPLVRLLPGNQGERVDVLQLELGAEPRSKLRAHPVAPTFRLSEPADPQTGSYRLQTVDGRWSIRFRPVVQVPDLSSTKDFLLAQFDATVADRPALTKEACENEPTLAALLPVWNFIDLRDAKRITRAQVEAYFALAEEAVRAQVWIRITDFGNNPWATLQTDYDEQITLRELAAVRDSLPAADRAEQSLPQQMQWTISGMAVPRWAGLRLPLPPRPRFTTAPFELMTDLAWFYAQDGNQDGEVSRREFLGTPEAFRHLDTNNDGWISRDEANNGTAPKRKPGP